MSQAYPARALRARRAVGRRARCEDAEHGTTISTAVVTVSDGVARGTRIDESGDLAESILRTSGFEVATRLVVPDERDDIEDTLRDLSASHGLIVTTGGTGFGPRDVTPEATRAVSIVKLRVSPS